MSCSFGANNTSATLDSDNTTGDKLVYQNVYHVLYGYGLPTICAFGFLGNVLNMVILAGKRMQRSLRKTEHSANSGLISLAVTDMAFCITAFPSTFLPQEMVFEQKGFLAYYGCYCAAVINIFIMTSTWLTVTMATERYLAICHPLKSRNIITLERTKAAIVLVYVFSALINVPMFLRYVIKIDSCRTYHVIYQDMFGSAQFEHAYRILWAVVGNIIPLILLLFFNVGLMREIHRSYAMRKRMSRNCSVKAQSSGESDSNRITVTLVAIVVMFFILVAPSEVLKHVAYLLEGDIHKNYIYLTIEIVTNVMQTINFSANFILYCIINPSFRRSMREMICFHYTKLQTEPAADKYGDHLTSSFRLTSTRTRALHSDSGR